VLGDYVREYITTPVVRDKLMPDLDRHGLDWRDPRIALGLLADVMGTAPFHDGCFRASGFFDLGVCVGTINILCETMERQAASMGERELAMLWWAELDLIAAARQISWRYMAARDLTRKPPRLRLGAELDVAARKESVRQFGTWIGEEFIGDRSPLCRWCFAVGANQATYWNEALRGRFSQEDQAEFLAAATQSTRELTSLLLEGIASHDERAALETKLAAALHLERFPQTGEFAATAEASSPQCMRGGEGLLSLADEIALELHHDLAAPDWRHADWAWLKTQVQDMASAGQDNVAIFVAPDGRLGTGLLTMPIPRKADYKREVPIVDERSALAIVRWVTWDDALAGRFPE
jgi:hypothetical protein